MSTPPQNIPHTPFPARVTHFPDEPAHSLLLRTATHNGARRPRSIFERFGAYGAMSVTTIDPVEVARVCRAEAVAVVAASPVVRPATVELLGQVLRRDHFSVQQQRWCPQCLTENAYHRSWWDVVAVTACPIHHVELATRCECQKPLKWHSNVGRCRMGHDLSVIATAAVADEDLVADAYIVARLTGGARQPVPLLDELPLGDAILAMERLGNAWIAEDTSLTKARQVYGFRLLQARGYDVIADLPTMAPRMFDRVMAGEGTRKGRWGTARAYGQLGLYILRLPDSLFASAMRAEFQKHAQANVTIKSNQKIGETRIAGNGLTMLEASEMCGISHERFRRIAVGLGIIPAKKIQGTPMRFDPTVIAALAERMIGLKSLDALAAELGINPRACKTFVEAGLIAPIMEKDSTGTNYWMFEKGTGDALLERLKPFRPKETVTGVNLAPLARAAQMAYTTIAQMVSMVFDGSVSIKGIDPTAIGLQQFLIGKSDAQKAMRRKRAPGNSLMEAVDKLGIGYNAVGSWANGGILKTVQHGRVKTVSDEEIERFKATYITVQEIRRYIGRPSSIIAELDKAGIDPVCARPEYFQVLYDRAEVMPVVESVARGRFRTAA